MQPIVGKSGSKRAVSNWRDRLKIVLDTNVLVSALIKFVGFEAMVVDLVASRVLQLFLTDAVLAEYNDVLSRPRLRLDALRVEQTLRMIAAEGYFVIPKTRVLASPDEKDNRFLECAEAAKADFLVTGNKRHFPSTWKTTRIVNARELLELLKSR